ncbi:MAG: hypothetical protein ACFFD1_16280, partial [Candidatus Thorarchaeota archaeon]
SYASTLTPGEQYSIVIDFHFANQSIINTQQQSRFSQLPPKTLNTSADNIFLELILTVKLSNGTIANITQSKTTNSMGEATFVLGSQDTENIIEIQSLNIKVMDAANGELMTLTDLTINSVHVLSPNQTPNNPLINLIIIFISIGLIVVFIGSLGYLLIKRSLTHKLTATDLRREQLHLLSDIYTVLATTDGGVPIYTIINSLYLNDPAVNDIVSSLSVGIDSFLQSFQSDFMKRIGFVSEKDSLPSETKTSVINRENFQILIIASPRIRLFVFTQHEPSQTTKNIFKKITEKLEEKLVLPSLINEVEMRGIVESIIMDNFPIILLNTFTIDLNRLFMIGNNTKNSSKDKISSEQIAIIKRLAIIRLGDFSPLSVSIEAVDKKISNFIDAGKKNIGVLHFEVAKTILEKTLKVKQDMIYETLWNASNKDLKIIIPFRE